jgi:hypothetical protein
VDREPAEVVHVTRSVLDVLGGVQYHPSPGPADRKKPSCGFTPNRRAVGTTFDPIHGSPDYLASLAYYRFRWQMSITAHSIRLLIDESMRAGRENDRAFAKLPEFATSDVEEEIYHDAYRSESTRDVCAGAAFVILKQSLDILKHAFLINGDWSVLRNGEAYSLPEIIEAASNNFRHWDGWLPITGKKMDPKAETNKKTLAAVINKPWETIVDNVCWRVMKWMCPGMKYVHLFARLCGLAERLVESKGIDSEKFPLVAAGRRLTYLFSVESGEYDPVD